jgi:hypothetical protein
LSSQKAYADLVAQAEQAVSGVKDAELRRVAFERVLEDLIGVQPASPPASSSGGRGQTASVRVGSGRRKRPRVRREGAKRSGPRAYIEELATEGFFKKQKTISDVKVELENRGHHIPMTSLSGPLQALCVKKTLRRQKIDTSGGKKTYGYSNW